MGVDSGVEPATDSPLGERSVLTGEERDEKPMTQRILVVEDEADLRASVAEVLRLEGYEVETAGNGEEALEKLEQGEPPGLILLDLMMPVMDGWEFRRRQLDDLEFADIPVLLFTSAKDLDDAQRELSPVGILEKPVSIATILEAIEGAV